MPSDIYTWQLIVESLTAVATIAGLIFIYRQVAAAHKQITAAGDALRSSAYQGVVTHSLVLIENLIARDDMLNLLANNMANEGAPRSSPEKLRWHFMALATMRHFENLSVQHELGSIRESEWGGYRNLLAFYLSRPGFRTWWGEQNHNEWFSQRFQNLVAELRNEEARRRAQKESPAE